jgi:hypothetical protein
VDEWAWSSLVPDSDLPVQPAIEGSVIAHDHLPGSDGHTGGGGLFDQFRVTLTRTVITSNWRRQYFGC